MRDLENSTLEVEPDADDAIEEEVELSATEKNKNPNASAAERAMQVVKMRETNRIIDREGDFCEELDEKK